MSVAPHIAEYMASSSFIRKMFEEGIQMKAQFGADNVYDFSLGNPDLEPPARIKTMLAQAATETQRGMHSYMPNAGYPFARAAMAEKVSAEQGVNVESSSIVMGVGAAGAMNSVLKALLSPGDEVLVPAPFFPEYTHYCRNHGGSLRPVKSLEDFSLDHRAIADALGKNTAAVIICSPNNPTGRVYSEQDIAELGAILEAHGKSTGRFPLLIADEPYREIVYDNRRVAPVFPVYSHSVVVSSFAKNLSLPGERIGYTAVNPAHPSCNELIDAIIFCTRILGYVNAPATFQRIVAECWKEPVDYGSYARRRDALTAILDKAGITYADPGGAFYLFCKVPQRSDTSSKGDTSPRGDSSPLDSTAGDDKAFCAHLKQFRILAVPGTGFGAPGWFRLAYCTAESTIENARDSFIQASREW